MRLTLFVHDLFLEIGHSNALIETVRNIPEEKIESLNVVSFTSDNLDKLFPKLKGKLHFHKVIFPNLKPFFFKIVFYHLYTFIYNILSRNTVRVSIGIATLQPDVVNLQFVHHHWNEHFFKQQKMKLLTYIYKKILFFYFLLCEKIVYRRKRVLFSSLSQYVTDYCKETLKIAPHRIKTIYSAVNLDKYQIINQSRQEIFEDLRKRYPALSQIDTQKEIFLFVGAYDRKGLYYVLEQLKTIKKPQIIVVGRAESKSSIIFPQEVNAVKIPFTTELPLFYQLADSFVFPTLYEPYGLVIAEAAVMGMRIYTTIENVGASELLHNQKEIHLFHAPKDLKLNGQAPLSPVERKELRETRIKSIYSKYSWENAGKQFYEICHNVSST